MFRGAGKCRGKRNETNQELKNMANKWFKAAAAAAMAGVLALGAAACNRVWNGNVTLKDPGEIVAGSNGGFVVETENYLYFINGEESYTADNALGTPLKGALMAVEKAKLGTAEAEAELIVPKLFAAGNTGAGVYVFGDRIYFATPSTKKDTSGNVANDHLEFASMKADGTDYTEYFTVSGNSTAYRFAESSDGNVHAVYYDSAEQSVVDYDVTAGEEVVVSGSETVSACTFLPNETAEKTGVAALYTVTPKNAATAADEAYNVVYAVKAGETAKAVLSGKRAEDGDGNPTGAPAATYAVSFAQGENVFLTESRTYSSEAESKTYGVSVADLYESGLASAVEYKNTALVVSTALFASLTEAYAAETDFLVKYDFTKGSDGKYKEVKSNVSKVSASTLFSLEGDDLYYTNADSALCKTDVTAGVDAKETRVSESAIVTDWFAPESGAGQIFWLDNGDDGLGYVNYAALGAEGIGEDTDDDGEDDLWYLESEKVFFLGEMKDADKTQSVTLKIAALSTSIAQIEYDRTAEEGERWTQEKQIAAARAAYNALSDELKEEISETDVELLEKYESYLEVSKNLMELAEYVEYDEGGWKLQAKAVTAENAADYQAKIDAIETMMDELGYTSSDKAVLVNGGLGAMQKMQADIDALNEDE